MGGEGFIGVDFALSGGLSMFPGGSPCCAPRDHALPLNWALPPRSAQGQAGISASQNAPKGYRAAHPPGLGRQAVPGKMPGFL